MQLCHDARRAVVRRAAPAAALRDSGSHERVGNSDLRRERLAHGSELFRD